MYVSVHDGTATAGGVRVPRIRSGCCWFDRSHSGEEALRDREGTMRRRLVLVVAIANSIALLPSPPVHAEALPGAESSIQRLNVTPSGGESLRGAWDVAISNDGQSVAFTSRAWDLVTDDFNNESDVFVRDVDTGTT